MTNIGDPFVLTTYALPKSARAGPSVLSNVFATNQYAPTNSSEEVVTVAAQGNGVHILDLSTLHPAISYTLGPQVCFSCPPVTRTTTSGDTKLCTTYVAIDSASELSSDARGKTIWKWKEEFAGSVTAAEAEKRRVSAKMPHTISRIYAPDRLPDHVVLVGTNGEVTVADENLSVKDTSVREGGFKPKRSFILPRNASPFGSYRSGGVVVIMVGTADSRVYLRVVAVSVTGVSEALGECPIPLDTSLSILDVTLSNSGFFSILTASGTWHTFDIQFGAEGVKVLQAAEPLKLTSLSFIPSASVSESPHKLEVSISSVGSSHVLMCGISSHSNAEIFMLLWDLRYSVVLASQTYVIPSALGRSKKNPLEITLVAHPNSPSHVVLVLSSLPPKHIVNGDSEPHLSLPDPNSRSVVLVVPLSVPITSKILNAIGRAADSAKWISSSAVSEPLPNQDGHHARILRSMKAAMNQKRPEAADEVLANWVKHEEARSPKTPEGTPKNKVELGYKFVQDILEIVLKQPRATTDNIPYSPKAVRYLLEQRAVSSGMVIGGLLSRLRIRKDWETMILALTTVIDIPETDLAILLHDVITQPKTDQTPADNDAMQVDSATKSSYPPSLSDLLALCVTYPISAAAMRVAIRKQLREAEELMAVLEVLLGWVESWFSEGKETKFFPTEARRDERGFLEPVVEIHNREDIPPLDKILSFVQVILDSSFLTFLSHPPSHKLIRQIMACLQPELELNDEIEQLQGPLQPFVRAQAKVVSDAINGPPKFDPKVDWRQRKKAMHEQAGMNVGLYQVEELAL